VWIPTLAISAWIPEKTVVTEEHRATSLIATMRERWNLGEPLTARDASARSFAGVNSLAEPRPQEDWPEVSPRPVPKGPDSLVPLDAPLGALAEGLFAAVLSLGLGAKVPEIDLNDKSITGAKALEISHEVLGDLFPAMRAVT
jgi:phospholipase C